jgi:DNA-binding winged helix-turn-helix (wHTH) protein/tetratricopeptide (TPR) repeat protein
MEKLRKFPKIPESIPQRCFYAFGPFRVDPVKRLLLRGDEPVSLSPKDFDLLLALVQHHGEVLVKEELMEGVWPDTVVEEGNLNRHISTLRKTLGESPNEHEYIVTVPGRGYRFVAEVRKLWDDASYSAFAESESVRMEGQGADSRVPTGFKPVPSTGTVLSPPAPWASAHSRLWGDRLRSSRLVKGTLVVVAAIAMALAGARLLVRSQPILTSTDHILISDFANTTGDPVFDDTLKQAVSVELAQSPFLNILSDARIRTMLKLMTKSADSKLTPDVARELCERAGCKAYIAGSIASLGSQYVIGLSAADCHTGDILAQEQVTAENKEHVLMGLDQAAAEIRRRLGESRHTLEKFDTPLVEATTPSLEALKSFSLGNLARDKKGDAATIPFYQRAIELDPSFALAYDALGLTYSNLDEPGLASEYITRAYDLRGRLSEREKFQIAANYSQIVTGELGKANQISELWAQAYPQDDYPHNLLGVNYEFLGQYEKAFAEMQEAVRLNPDGVVLRSDLMEDYAALNRLDEARATYRQALERKLDHPYLHADMYGVAFLQGDKAEMDRQVALSIGTQGAEDLLLSIESDTKAFSGNLAKAREYSRRAVDAAKRNNQKETAAEWQMNEALREAEFGNFEVARQKTAEALSIASTRDVQILAALTLARVGASSLAQTMGDDLVRRFPLNTVINGYWLPSIRAAIEISLGRPARSIDILAAAVPYESGYPNPQVEVGRLLYPVFLRGQAYLLMQRGDEAIVEFQKILNARGLIENCHLGALAQLGLARAYALQSDKAKARSAYQAFFALWKDADPGIPILAAAKSEYAKLR